MSCGIKFHSVIHHNAKVSISLKRTWIWRGFLENHIALKKCWKIGMGVYYFSYFSIKTHVVCIKKNELQDRKDNINVDSQIRTHHFLHWKKLPSFNLLSIVLSVDKICELVWTYQTWPTLSSDLNPNGFPNFHVIAERTLYKKKEKKRATVQPVLSGHSKIDKTKV